MSTSRNVRAPRGAQLSCKGWHQEAALRCLMNNLDCEVAEKPDELIVYGGAGKAARNWDSFDAIVRSLQNLENDETLLVQSGKPVAVFQTPGSNALAVADGVKRVMADLKQRFPPDLEFRYSIDTTLPVSQGIKEILITLGIAIAAAA